METHSLRSLTVVLLLYTSCFVEYIVYFHSRIFEERTFKKDDSENYKRIPCPNDPKHSCFENKLQKHLAVCNARPQERAYLHHGINCGDEVTVAAHQVLGDIDEGKLQCIIDKINSVYDEVIPNIAEKILNHPILNEELMNPNYGASTRKHLIQNSSLLGLLADGELLQDNTCFIELGAGRGQLSYWIAKATEDFNKCLLVLVDRASQRHKFENRLKHLSGPSFIRIRADIADLCVSKIKEVHDYQHIVAFSKHLCGAATDMALRCLTSDDPEFGASSLNIAGILMALCCHHRCDWRTYVGKEFLSVHEFTEADFHIMCGITSWAVCGWHRIPETQRVLPFYSQDEKKEIGLKCKVILDYGRIHYLKNRNFDCSLLYYVSQSVTPENVCILAKVSNAGN